MKIDVSDINKNSGASLNIEFCETVPELDANVSEFTFNGPICFKGQITNVSGVLKLNGRLKANYIVKCYRCLTEINDEIDVTIKEDFANNEAAEDSEMYTYTGNYVTLDKMLEENIILSLPMRQACTESCRGICFNCGKDLNTGSCECAQQTTNPKMEVLKNFFNK